MPEDYSVQRGGNRGGGWDGRERRRNRDGSGWDGRDRRRRDGYGWDGRDRRTPWGTGRGGGRGGRRWYDRIRIRPRLYPCPYGCPRNRCYYIDRYGRCCDRYGRCYYRNPYPRYFPMGMDGQEMGWEEQQTAEPMLMAGTDDMEFED